MAKQCVLCHKNKDLFAGVNYNNKFWHTSCFNCTSCTRRLTVEVVESLGDRIYCSHCYRSKAQHEQPRSETLSAEQKPKTPTLPPPSGKDEARPTKPLAAERANSLGGGPARRTTDRSPIKRSESETHSSSSVSAVPDSQKKTTPETRRASVQIPVPEAPSVKHPAPETRRRSSVQNPSHGARSKRISLSVVCGSICNQEVDVIVNSIGTHHDLSRGALSRALLDQAGPALQKDLDKEVDGDPMARVYVTRGHRLTCRHVIHAICGGYDESKESTQDFCSLVDEILTTADRLGAKSIAIPPIGTGNLGYPASFVAKMIAKSIEEYTSNSSSSSSRDSTISDIKFVVLETDETLLKEFRNAIRRRDQPLMETDSSSVSEKELREQDKLAEELRQSLRASISSDTKFPSTWIISESTKSYERHVINQEGAEYKQVVRNMTDCDGAIYVDLIRKIARIENKGLYEMFEASKQIVKKHSRADTVERILWHGTTEQSLDSICQYGFNRAYCGKNGVLYGKGVYYARDFSYSAKDMYSPPDSYNLKCVIQCRVLTGNFTNGDEDMLVPPEMSPGRQYDSTVDDCSDPSIFVVFYDYRMYPEYVIWFNDQLDDD